MGWEPCPFLLENLNFPQKKKTLSSSWRPPTSSQPRCPRNVALPCSVGPGGRGNAPGRGTHSTGPPPWDQAQKQGPAISIQGARLSRFCLRRQEVPLLKIIAISSFKQQQGLKDGFHLSLQRQSLGHVCGQVMEAALRGPADPGAGRSMGVGELRLSPGSSGDPR